jgi:putative endonuclease
MRVYESYVYMVASRSRTLYIGMTNRLQARIAERKAGTFAGFSRDYHCTRLVYFERCGGPAGAILREKQLKGWRREKKVLLIERTNPTWEDLSLVWNEPIPCTNGQRWIECLGRWSGCTKSRSFGSTSLRSG